MNFITWFKGLIHSEEIYQIVLMALIGLISGAVRVCGNPKIHGWRVMISSLMASAFAGGLTAAILHERITDIVFLGAMCSVGGYLGQLTLVLISKIVMRRLGITINMEDDNVQR